VILRMNRNSVKSCTSCRVRPASRHTSRHVAAAHCFIARCQNSVSDVKLSSITRNSTLPGEEPLAKKKEQKKKERERRVAQKKHAAAQKRTQEKSAQETSKAGRKAELFTAPVAAPKSNYVSSSVPKPFNYRRSGGGG
jgi:hypothetical protein